MPDLDRVLDRIANCEDPESLRVFMRNAQQRGLEVVYDAAFERLVSVQSSEHAHMGSIERGVWRTIHAFEEMLKEERGKTVRLSRTRQKINRAGERRLVVDLIRQPKPSDGFEMLIARNRLELSFEALVVARATEFPIDVVDGARARLEEHDADFERIRDYWS